MNELITQISLATIGSVSGSTTSRKATLIFDGAESATEKAYKIMNNASLYSGSRVLIAKVSGSYVILGSISNV